MEVREMEAVMESAADYYRYLGATSLCSGFSIECLISLEKYRTTRSASALRAATPECQKFIKHTIAVLKEEEEAPYSIRKIYRELLTKKQVNKEKLLEGWQIVDNVISKISQNSEPEEREIDESITFLKTTIIQFNDISEDVEKKLYASSRFNRELV